MPTNYVISVQGRGASYCFMTTCEPSELLAKCDPALKSGFECYIYSLEPSPLGQPGFTPTGSLCLRRLHHVFAAHDQYVQQANDIVDSLSLHSSAATREYLQSMLDIFNKELASIPTGT